MARKPSDKDFGIADAPRKKMAGHDPPYETRVTVGRVSEA
jgi:hypothetical protein